MVGIWDNFEKLILGTSKTHKNRTFLLSLGEGAPTFNVTPLGAAYQFPLSKKIVKINTCTGVNFDGSGSYEW